MLQIQQKWSANTVLITLRIIKDAKEELIEVLLQVFVLHAHMETVKLAM